MTAINTYGDPGADAEHDREEWAQRRRDPVRDSQPALSLPTPPPGHTDWEQVDQRAHHRAWKDDLPCLTVDFVHGDQHQTRFFIAHYRSHP